MTTPNGSDTFYGGIAVFRGFGSLMDPALYSPLPDDWTIGVADIVESTRAIANSRGGTRKRARAVWLAPPGLRDDDLLYAFGDAQRSRSFHRRRARRLCLGGHRAEGDGGVKTYFSARSSTWCSPRTVRL